MIGIRHCVDNPPCKLLYFVLVINFSTLQSALLSIFAPFSTATSVNRWRVVRKFSVVFQKLLQTLQKIKSSGMTRRIFENERRGRYDKQLWLLSMTGLALVVPTCWVDPDLVLGPKVVGFWASRNPSSLKRRSAKKCAFISSRIRHCDWCSLNILLEIWFSPLAPPIFIA